MVVWHVGNGMFGKVRKGSERFGIFFQHSFGELKLDEIGRPGRGGGQKLNEVERFQMFQIVANSFFKKAPYPPTLKHDFLQDADCISVQHETFADP